VTRAAGSFTVVGGDEQTIHEAEGQVRLTRVTGTQRFGGAIVGDGSVAWVFCCKPDRTASFVGFQRVQGSISGRAGSFVMESAGDHDGHRSMGHWRVIPGSGTGELAGLSGQGIFEAPGGSKVSYELDYHLD
jgi:hypothetical protein